MKITAFVSGAGTTLAHLFNEQKTRVTSKSHLWQITAVISDQAKAEALNVAKKNGVEPTVISPSAFTSAAEYERHLLNVLATQKPDIILLLGYLKKVNAGVVRMYQGRIFNTHPSLLPKFGGKGMYGRFVHEAVIKAGEQESGVTIHEVTEVYDDGRILLQKKLKIEKKWSAQELETAVKQIEKDAMVEFLTQYFKSTGARIWD